MCVQICMQIELFNNNLSVRDGQDRVVRGLKDCCLDSRTIADNSIAEVLELVALFDPIRWKPIDSV